MSERLQKTMYFTEVALMERFFAWCKERGLAPGRVVQNLVEAHLPDLELQKDQVTITLPVKEVRFT